MQNGKSKNGSFSGNIAGKLQGICGSVARTTVRFFRNLPGRAVNFVKRKINEYKRKPPREDINKVYVLVGYTTKKHIDARYNRERELMILRRGLLLIIFVLLLLISFKSFVPYIDVDQYRNMFGFGDVEELTENDPFAENAVTVPTVIAETSSETSETF